MDQYKETYNSEPGIASPMSYDGIKLMADAISRAGSTDPQAVVKALKEIKQYKGISAEISFTDQNVLEKGNFILLKAHNGQWELFE